MKSGVMTVSRQANRASYTQRKTKAPTSRTLTMRNCGRVLLMTLVTSRTSRSRRFIVSPVCCLSRPSHTLPSTVSNMRSCILLVLCTPSMAASQLRVNPSRMTAAMTMPSSRALSVRLPSAWCVAVSMQRLVAQMKAKSRTTPMTPVRVLATLRSLMPRLVRTNHRRVCKVVAGFIFCAKVKIFGHIGGRNTNFFLTLWEKTCLFTYEKTQDSHFR